jgi:hypothetical protein
VSIVKKIGLFLGLSLFASGAAIYAVEFTMKSQGGLSAALEAMKIKRQKPTMSPDEVKRHAALAPKGLMGLYQGLMSSQSLTMSESSISQLEEGDTLSSNSEPPAKSLHISVRENPKAMIERQIQPGTDEAQVKGIVQDISNRRTVEVSRTSDGREAVALIHDPSIHDFNDIDRIMAMNIPEDLRAKILKNYQETGVLPEILVKEKVKRNPSSDGATEQSSHPYNRNSW